MTIFFESWDSITRIIISGLIVYPCLILLLRFAGKRSLSKLNAFDFIVTVALGSIFASAFVWSAVTILDGLVAIFLLLIGQFVVSHLSVRFNWFEHFIKSEPMLVFFEGEFLEDALLEIRITKEEIYAEARQQNFACLTDVYAIVVETNGVVSVLSIEGDVTDTTLRYVKNYHSET